MLFEVLLIFLNFYAIIFQNISDFYWLAVSIMGNEYRYLFIRLFKINLNFVQSVSWKWKSACINYWCLYRLLPQRALFYSPSRIVYFYVKMNSSKPFYAQGSEDAKIIYRDPETISSFSLIPVTVQ